MTITTNTFIQLVKRPLLLNPLSRQKISATNITLTNIADASAKPFKIQIGATPAPGVARLRGKLSKAYNKLSGGDKPQKPIRYDGKLAGCSQMQLHPILMHSLSHSRQKTEFDEEVDGPSGQPGGGRADECLGRVCSHQGGRAPGTRAAHATQDRSAFGVEETRSAQLQR